MFKSHFADAYSEDKNIEELKSVKQKKSIFSICLPVKKFSI